MTRNLFPFLYLLTLLCLGAVELSAQQNDLELGRRAYWRSDYPGAIKHLRNAVKKNKNDAEIWALLGSAYLQVNKPKDSIKAYETATSLEPRNDRFLAGLSFALTAANDFRANSIALRSLEINPNNVDAHYALGVLSLRSGSFDAAYKRANRISELDKDNILALQLKHRALMGSFRLEAAVIDATTESRINRLSEAIQILERLVSLTPDASSKKELNEELATLKFFHEYYSRPDVRERLDRLPPHPVDSTFHPPVFKSLPQASYTTQARQAGVVGSVELLVAFMADGTIGPILVQKGLGYGLNEQAITAARRITFKPATKNGLPDTIVRSVEYTFSIY